MVANRDRRESEPFVLDELTAVVVNWGTPDLTSRSVASLIEDGVPPRRIVVVDNGSEDDSYARFQRELPGCVVHRLEENVGYARAANAGARLLDGGAYLLVNNDAFVHKPGSVLALARCLQDPSIGVAVARILNEDLTVQRSTFPIRTPTVALALAAGVGWIVPNRWQPQFGWRWDHSVSREIAATNAVAMLVRGETWKRLDGFAELAWLYRNCTFTLFPSRYEGWGLPISESLDFGKLCLAADNSSLPEAGEGLVELLDPFDRLAWRDCVLKYWTETRLRAAREREISRAHRHVSSRDTAEVLLSVLSTDSWSRS